MSQLLHVTKMNQQYNKAFVRNIHRKALGKVPGCGSPKAWHNPQLGDRTTTGETDGYRSRVCQRQTNVGSLACICACMSQARTCMLRQTQLSCDPHCTYKSSERALQGRSPAYLLEGRVAEARA